MCAPRQRLERVGRSPCFEAHLGLTSLPFRPRRPSLSPSPSVIQFAHLYHQLCIYPSFRSLSLILYLPEPPATRRLFYLAHAFSHRTPSTPSGPLADVLSNGAPHCTRELSVPTSVAPTPIPSRPFRYSRAGEWTRSSTSPWIYTFRQRQPQP